MDYRWLQAQAFIATIAEEGSFLRAAKRLRTAPSFLTRKIAEVERDLRTGVFDRTTRRLELTAVGRLVLPEIQVALRHSERAWELAHYYGRLLNGPIRIGYSPYAQESLIRALHRVDARQLEAQLVTVADSPEPRLEFQGATTPELIECVLRAKIHAGVGVQPVFDPELWTEVLAREPFCVCLPRGHALTQKPTISARDLHGQTLFWIRREMHPGFYDRMVKYIRSTGARPLYQEGPSMTQAIEMVVHGLGIALLPNSAVRLSRAGVVFRTINDRYLQIETVLFTKKEFMHGVLQDLMQFLVSHLRAVKPSVQ
ncbi:MAG TPA: LysR family transcriptional regulator [Terriglobales bacterium]|nr:LysR family transcriptional regulator [Terriglobales bacterium]